VRSRAHDADMRIARLPGQRHRADADADFGGSSTLDEIPRIDAYGYVRKSHRGATLRKTRIPNDQVIHRRRLAALTANLFRLRFRCIYNHWNREDYEMEWFEYGVLPTPTR